MSEDAFKPEETSDDSPEIDSAALELARQRLRAEQNLFGGALAGAAASLLGAAIWAGITVGTGYQIGFMAIGIGFLVGFAVRAVGRGIDGVFGVVGAVLAFMGCVLGNLFSVVGIAARRENQSFMDVLAQVDLSAIPEMMAAFMGPMDLVFYGIAVYEGYKLSFRPLSTEELMGRAG